jgi:hypothetical protein
MIVGLASLVSQPMRKVIMAVWEATDLHLRHDVFGKYLATKYRRVMMLPFLKT